MTMRPWRKRVLEMQLGARLSQHIADLLIDGEGFDLVENRGDRGLDELLGPACELALEERARHWIAGALDDA